MRFNVDKCKVMHLGKRNAGGSYVMNGGTLGEVNEERDLGVRITSDLKATAQCNYVCSKANRVLGMIRRTMVYRSPGHFDKAVQELGEAALGVLCVGLVTALCEGQGEVGKGPA